MTSAVLVRDEDNVRILQINNPPVNALSWPVRSALVEELNKAQADDKISALVISCTGRTFVAGADISEFGQPPREPKGPQLMASKHNNRSTHHLHNI